MYEIYSDTPYTNFVIASFLYRLEKNYLFRLLFICSVMGSLGENLQSKQINQPVFTI